MKNTKKTIKMLVVAMAIVCASPMVFSATTVTGTFTPTSSGISIACNKTAPTFGDIALGANAENTSFNVTNEGATNCSVKMTAGEGAGTWTLVAGTASPATTNQYCINVNPNASGYVDAQAEQTISSDLPPAGIAWNYTHFDLKVFVSEYTNEGAPEEQTFYANLTAAEIT